MVSLTVAANRTLEINGVVVEGPVHLVGDSMTVLGQTLESGTWLVGLEGDFLSLVQLGGSTWWVSDLAYPFAILLGFAVALRSLVIR